jgi:hypothetical protein
MIKIFSRPAWQVNPDWPNGYEPYTRPVEECRVLRMVHSEQEAREECGFLNRGWRRLQDRDRTPTQDRVFHLANRYEYTEL